MANSLLTQKIKIFEDLLCPKSQYEYFLFKFPLDVSELCNFCV